MKRIGIGLLTIATVLTALYNLGWLWLALGLHDNKPNSNYIDLGAAVALLLGLLAGVAWCVGYIIDAMINPRGIGSQPLKPHSDIVPSRIHGVCRYGHELTANRYCWCCDKTYPAIPPESQTTRPLPPPNVRMYENGRQ